MSVVTQQSYCCVCKTKYEPGNVVYRDAKTLAHVCSKKCRTEFDSKRIQKAVFTLWDVMTFMSEPFKALNCTLKKVTVDTKEATPAPQAVFDLPGGGISIDALTKFSGSCVSLTISRDYLKLKTKAKKPDKKAGKDPKTGRSVSPSPKPPAPPLDPEKKVN